MRTSALTLLAILPFLAFSGSSSQVPRKKRSLAFPKGSAFVLTMTLLKPIQIREPSNWNLDMEFDMIWPLPPEANAFRVERVHRRQRRELYANFQSALDSQGLPGEQCILRTICEVREILNPPGSSLFEDILRVMFSYPERNGSRSDDTYDEAYAWRNNCDIGYPCPFSLLNVLLSLLYNNK